MYSRTQFRIDVVPRILYGNYEILFLVYYRYLLTAVAAQRKQEALPRYQPQL